jgi:creatinine amidohydrolase
MQLEEYLVHDDRIVVPLGSVEQHAYLSLGVDAILSERVALEAAEPLGIPVLPALPFGVTPYFAAFPGSPTLSAATYGQVLTELFDGLHGQGFRRFAVVNGHGGNDAGRSAAEAWAGSRDARLLWCNWWAAPKTRAAVDEIDSEASHGSWMENFPWTRLPNVAQPDEHKPAHDISHLRDGDPIRVREFLGDGQLGGWYERPDSDVLRIWQIAVDETRSLLGDGWDG